MTVDPTESLERVERQLRQCSDSYEAPSGKIMVRVWVTDLAAVALLARSSAPQEPDDGAFLHELDLVAPNIRASHNNTVFTRDEIMRAFKRYSATRLQAKAPETGEGS